MRVRGWGARHRGAVRPKSITPIAGVRFLPEKLKEPTNGRSPNLAGRGFACDRDQKGQTCQTRPARCAL